MRLSVRTGTDGSILIADAATGEPVENVVHIRFEADAKRGWLAYIVIAPTVDITGEFAKVPVMPAVRGYEKEHSR